MRRRAFLGSAAAVLLGTRAAAAHASLHARVAAIARTASGPIGVYARTMAPGPPLVAYDAREFFPSASVVKVLVMLTAYVLEERTPGTLRTSITTSRDDLIGGSDFMSEQPDGAVFTVRALIRPMIRVSDNTAANTLIGHFGVRAINAVAAQAGLTRTHLARKFIDSPEVVRHEANVSTPADMGHLLYLIEKGAREDVPTIVSAKYCREMMAIMLGQTDRDKIPAALPPGTAVANKTGEITGTRNDVAIVEPYGDSPFVLAIMTKEIVDYDAAYDAIHAIARTIYHATARSFA